MAQLEGYSRVFIGVPSFIPALPSPLAVLWPLGGSDRQHAYRSPRDTTALAHSESAPGPGPPILARRLGRASSPRRSCRLLRGVLGFPDPLGDAIPRVGVQVPWADASPSGRTIDRASLKSTSSPSTRLLRADIGCFAGSAPTRRTASPSRTGSPDGRASSSRQPAPSNARRPHSSPASARRGRTRRPRGTPPGPRPRWAPDSPPKVPACTGGCISGRALLLCSSRRAEVPSVGAVRLAIADWTSCGEATEPRGT
jgi:hypothetical protein